jgi:hypothetical protein
MYTSGIAAAATFLAIVTIVGGAPSTWQDHKKVASEVFIGLGVGVLFAGIAFIWATVIQLTTGAL